MQEQTSEFGESKQKMVSGFKRLLADAEALLRTSSGITGEGIDSAREKVQRQMGMMKDAMSEAEIVARDRYRQASDQTISYIRSHPGKALGVAVAAGLLIGMLINSRR